MVTENLLGLRKPKILFAPLRVKEGTYKKSESMTYATRGLTGDSVPVPSFVYEIVIFRGSTRSQK